MTGCMVLLRGGIDRIRLFANAKSLPFLVARKKISELIFFARSLVRLNLQFTSCQSYQNKNKVRWTFFLFWYARQDLNLRPFAPQANALSS